VALFAPVFLAYGGLLSFSLNRLKIRFYHKHGGQIGIIWLFVLGISLTLGLISVSSLNDYPFPQVITQIFQTLGISYDASRTILSLFVLGFSVMYFGTSMFIFWRGYQSRMAKFAALSFMIFAAAFFNSRDMLTLLFTKPSGMAMESDIIRTMGFLSLLLLFYLFPDGGFTPRWTRPLAIIWAIWVSIWFLHIFPESPISPTSWPKGMQLTFVVSSLGSGVLAQVLRYRTMETTQQTKIRLVVVGFSGAVLGFGLLWLTTLVIPDTKAMGSPRLPLTSVFAFAPYLLPWALIPQTIATAILRNRLWEN
jgi:hypothetical protein